jgi:predicted AAA+ superfamily ATPase
LDNELIFNVLESYNIDTYKTILTGNKQIILDELHLLSNPGRAVKIIYDQIEDIQIVVTGSSALHIKNKASESMAGRKIDYHLYPLTFTEYLFQKGIVDEITLPIIGNIVQGQVKTVKLYSQTELLESIMKFGLYPDLLNMPDKRKYLLELADSAVFKDIVALNLIENRAKAKELLRLLAYQIGNLVNYQELSTRLDIDRRTVERYIEIFEQSFILYRVYPFSKKSRDEIGKAPKIYFWDLGLRNALIDNFDEIGIRSDSGAMFENFIITEVKKEISYLDLDFKVNYWRLKSGAEIDLVLHNHKMLIGCEVKLRKSVLSSSFKNRYPDAKTCVITSENFM